MFDYIICTVRFAWFTVSTDLEGCTCTVICSSMLQEKLSLLALKNRVHVHACYIMRIATFLIVTMHIIIPVASNILWL